MSVIRDRDPFVTRMRHVEGHARVFHYSEFYDEEIRIADFVHGVDAIEYCRTRNAGLANGGRLPEPEGTAETDTPCP